MGRLDEAIVFGERAQGISRLIRSDPVLFQLSLEGTGTAYFFKGDSQKLHEFGKILLDYGLGQSDIRSTAVGRFCVACGHFLAGDFPSAIDGFQRAIEISVDPIWSCFVRVLLGWGYICNNQLQEAENTVKEVMTYSERFGTEVWGMRAQALHGIILIGRGNLGQGVRLVEDVLRAWLEKESRFGYATVEHLLGKIHLQIVQGGGPKSLSFLARNIGFLLKNLPFARKKAEDHFNKAIEVAQEIGTKGILGQAYLDLGLLHKTKGKNYRARECISEAVKLFEQCHAEIHLRRAKELLEDLG
jgi:tetratricopeptide (TPR) repeat protein